MCTSTSQAWLIFVNVELCMAGLALLGFGGYVWASMPETKSSMEAASPVAPYTPFIAGGVLLLIGLAGCLGAESRSRCTLMVYWLGVLIVTAVVLAMGTLVMLATGSLDNVRVGDSQSLVTSMHHKLNDFSLDVFATCCEAPVKGSSSKVTACGTHYVLPGAMYACVHDMDFYQQIEIPQALCVALNSTTLGGERIVGPLPSRCVSPEDFMDIFFEYVNNNVYPIAIVLIVLSVTLLLTLVATCCLICSNRQKYGNLSVYPQ
jgi:hypothetical protein